MNANEIAMWLALGEGMRLTWVSDGYYHERCLFWSGELRGERVVECTFKPQAALPPIVLPKGMS